MVTAEDIQIALMDPTERGTRAVGRALVLLYSKAFGGKHENPMGISASQYYLNHNTLTDKQLSFWRRPLRDGSPHILIHVDELLELANDKLKRRKMLLMNNDPSVQHITNQHQEYLEHAQDLLRSNEPAMYRSAVKQLRKYELLHDFTPSPLQISHDIELDIMAELSGKHDFA